MREKQYLKNSRLGTMMITMRVYWASLPVSLPAECFNLTASIQLHSNAVSRVITPIFQMRELSLRGALWLAQGFTAARVTLRLDPGCTEVQSWSSPSILTLQMVPHFTSRKTEAQGSSSKFQVVRCGTTKTLSLVMTLSGSSVRTSVCTKRIYHEFT